MLALLLLLRLQPMLLLLLLLLRCTDCSVERPNGLTPDLLLLLWGEIILWGRANARTYRPLNRTPTGSHAGPPPPPLG